MSDPPVPGDWYEQSIKSLHTDISTLTGERIIIFSLGGTVVLPPANA